MTKLLMFFAVLGFALPGFAQQTSAAAEPATMEVTVPEYVYCQIITDCGPLTRGSKVLFDFGQQTENWAYNWLCDAQGERLLFYSGIEALNYMAFRGWEFVQAYASGEDGYKTHFLLRLSTSRLNEQQLQQLSRDPGIKISKKSS